MATTTKTSYVSKSGKSTTTTSKVTKSKVETTSKISTATKHSYVSEASKQVKAPAVKKSYASAVKKEAPKQIDMEDIERFRVKKLKDELNENLHKVITGLKEEQADLFTEEESRMETLKNLE